MGHTWLNKINNSNQCKFCSWILFDIQQIKQNKQQQPVWVLQRFKRHCQKGYIDSQKWKYDYCRTMEEAIQRANNTRYGLAAGIVTKNIDTANTVSRSIKAGIIWINCYFAFDNDCPYGGYKMSGFERDLGLDALYKYTQVKSVVTPLYNSPWL